MISDWDVKEQVSVRNSAPTDLLSTPFVCQLRKIQHNPHKWPKQPDIMSFGTHHSGVTGLGLGRPQVISGTRSLFHWWAMVRSSVLGLHVT